MAKNVVALFNRYDEANEAVHELESAGFLHENISVISARTEAHAGGPPRDPVLVGVIAGGLVGLLAGLGAIAIPDVISYLWWGPIAGLAVGAALGAMTGFLVRRATGQTGAEAETAPALPENAAAQDVEGSLLDDPTRFEGDAIVAEAVRRGGTVVMAYVDDVDADRAAEALYRHHPAQISHYTATMHAQTGQQPLAGSIAGTAVRASGTAGSRRPTAPLSARPYPRRASAVPLESVQGNTEAVPGKSAYEYDRTGAEMSHYRSEPIDRPPLPEALDPTRDPSAPSKEE